MFQYPSFRLIKIFGIPIEINATWFIIFALITFSLIYEFSSPLAPSLFSFIEGILASFLFFFSVLFHEISHSLVARRNGLSIRKITLFVFGGIAQMEGEPKSPIVELKMALAGPFSSYLLGAFFFLLAYLVRNLTLKQNFYHPFQFLSWINVALGTFNLVPGFPLDGGRVFRAFLWHISKDLEKATRWASKGGQAVAFILIFYGLFQAVRGDFVGLWLVFLGWFLNQAASLSYQQIFFQKILSGIKVEEIMSPNVLTVSSSLTLEDLVDDYFLKVKFGRFPVVEGENLLGIVSLNDLKEIPREDWDKILVREVVRPLKSVYFITPEDDAAQALMQMAREEVSHLLVVKDGAIKGIVTKSDIIKLIKVKSELGI